LIIPASTKDALRILEDLEPKSTESYRAALGGVELHPMTVAPMWRRWLEVFCGFDFTGRQPPNRRAACLIVGGYVRGDVLFTGVQGGDLPLEFLSYLDDNRLMGSTLEI
jgi:hypothetical protein